MTNRAGFAGTLSINHFGITRIFASIMIDISIKNLSVYLEL